MNTLSRVQADGLCEVLNIGVGHAASVLNSMLDSHIQLKVPAARIVPIEMVAHELANLGEARVSSVQLGFSGAFDGTAALVFPVEAATKLVDTITEGEFDGASDDLDALRVGTLSEVGNIVINGVMGSITNLLEQSVDYAVPEYREELLGSLFEDGQGEMALLAHTSFSVESLAIAGEVILVFEMSSFDDLLRCLEDA